ncbi:MAG: Holliday junction branch migration protein RuvA [Alphaproteobacteria bacterium]
MIGKLTGLVDEVRGDHLIIDVSGVGYLVQASAVTLAQLPGHGRKVSLLIETDVGEDHIRLYGFAEPAERDWFRLLNGVQGVSGRLALAVLSVMPPRRLAQAIAADDRRALTAADGVGPKLAARITTELKDRATTLALMSGALAAGADGAAPAVFDDDRTGGSALSVLANLGYGRSEAFAALAAAERRLGPDAALESLIRESLRELAS